jgi:hypothetical protein
VTCEARIGADRGVVVVRIPAIQVAGDDVEIPRHDDAAPRRQGRHELREHVGIEILPLNMLSRPVDADKRRRLLEEKQI